MSFELSEELKEVKSWSFFNKKLPDFRDDAGFTAITATFSVSRLKWPTCQK